MRIVFGNWKYIFKNLWFVLPFALLPALFLTLSVDYTNIATYVKNLFAGNPRGEFVDLFRAWSIVRFDSVLGGVYSILAFVCVAFFSAFLLSLAEKHMRIGKRTLSGAFSRPGSMLLICFLTTLLYLALYEAWALVMAAVLYAAGALAGTAAGVYLLSALAFAVLVFALAYVISVFFLWLPCLQITGFRPYEAFRYSYQLMSGVRWKLILTFLLSLAVLFAVTAACALFLPEVFFRAVLYVFYAFLFLGFCIRMETVYFAADKIGREDLIRSYREL